MTQLEVVPLRIVEFRPLPGRPTAHAMGRARAEDDSYYIVKRNVVPDEQICATEWVCNSIADSLGIPTAETKILSGPNGELIFGSKEIVPKLPEIEAQRLLLDKQANSVFIPQLAQRLTETYALDLAVGNVDRHQDNFVIALSSGADQQIGNIHLIDFGSADLLRDEQVDLPLLAGSNTVRIGRQLRDKHGFLHEAAGNLLSRFRDGRKFIAERALLGLPDEWLTADKRRKFVAWINGEGFDNRLRGIESGLINGSYL